VIEKCDSLMSEAHKYIIYILSTCIYFVKPVLFSMRNIFNIVIHLPVVWSTVWSVHSIFFN